MNAQSSFLIGEQEQTTDLLIVGAGPIGLSAAFWAGMRCMSCRIVEAMPEIGGQLAVLYPEKWIYDIPGYRAIKARDLVAALKDQSIGQFGFPVHLGHRAEVLRHCDDHVELVTSGGTFRARAVLLTVGNGAFAPRKLPELDLDGWEQRGVHYYVPSLDRFNGRRVMVVGGGDSACDWALELTSRASAVSLVHRRAAFRAHDRTVDELRRAEEAGAVRILAPYELAAVEGSDRVRAVTLRDVGGHAMRRVEVDDILLQLGFVSALGPLLKWGMDVHHGAIRVDGGMRTSLSRVWACGDASTYDGKIKLIATGFAEAATAVAHVASAIGGQPLRQPEHSTTTGVPGAPAARAEVAA